MGAGGSAWGVNCERMGVATCAKGLEENGNSTCCGNDRHPAAHVAHAAHAEPVIGKPSFSVSMRIFFRATCNIKKT